MATTGVAQPIHHAFSSTSTISTNYTLLNSQNSTQMSPTGSGASTPSSVSPVSPRNVPFHTRQLRPPKSPLYIPAVLRPTDPPRRARTSTSISTSPRSTLNDESFVSGDRARRWTGDSKTFGSFSGTSMEHEWIAEQGFGKVTALPTRDHWKSDASTSICDEPTCHRTFTYFTRRHHCRRCGNIFCDEHSSAVVPLDQNANYHPSGARSRACNYCYREFKQWQSTRWNSCGSDQDTDVAPDTPTSVLDCNPINKVLKGVDGKGGEGKHGDFVPQSLAKSIPRDWNWSTF